MVATSQDVQVVVASGTFDLLHFGHLRYLEEAKKVGGSNAKLIVIVARDTTVKKTKGTQPILPEDQRRTLVESLKVVDEALLGYEEFDIEKVVENLRPDIVAVGHDQKDIEEKLRDAIQKKQLGIRVVRIGRFGKKELNSSSKIKRKIIESFPK